MGISIVREYSEKVKPPRTIFVRWPFGHPLGEPFNVRQQQAVLARSLCALCSLREPGSIEDLPYRWRRERYDTIDVHQILAACSSAPADRT